MRDTPFKIHGLTQSQKDFLQRYAQDKLGSHSRTKAIIDLINKGMQIEINEPHTHHHLPEKPFFDKPVVEQGGEKKRLQLSLRASDYENLAILAKKTDSSIQYYLIALIIKHLYQQKRLLGNEFELLRQSNYELHKVGVNLNQIAKALNSNELQIPPNLNSTINKIDSHIDFIKQLLSENFEKY